MTLNASRRFDADEIWDLVERENVSVISLVGDAMARPLVDALAHRPAPPSLFALVSGGAILSPSIKQELNERAPNVAIIDAFGASETGANGAVDVTDKGPRFHMNEWTTVITETGDVPPVGEVGLLARRGHVPVGYYKDAEKTAATFMEMHGVRWAIPGDRAVIEDDGTITVLGRGSQCINTGGEKVFPEEVEAVLKSHPDVFDAVVVGVPDDRWGETVAAVIARRAGHEVSPDALDRALPHRTRRLQAAPARRVRRDGRTHARGQAELPLGQGHRARRVVAAVVVVVAVVEATVLSDLAAGTRRSSRRPGPPDTAVAIE